MRSAACHAIKAAGIRRTSTHSTHIQHGVDCIAATRRTWWKPARIRRRSVIGIAQSNFFNVPKLPEETRWLHNSQLNKPQPELCFGCHGNIQAQFALPTHHRVPEGAMKCTDCHNPHGTSNRANAAPERMGDLHPMPRREARAFRLRTLGSEGRRLHGVPHAARQRESRCYWSAAESVSCACNAT